MVSTWSIKSIMENYREAINKAEKDNCPYTAANQLKETYAAAIRILFKNEYGDVFIVDDFVEHVKSGYIMDDDGNGYFANIDGDQFDSVYCDEDWIHENRKDYPFIIWYNR